MIRRSPPPSRIDPPSACGSRGGRKCQKSTFFACFPGLLGVSAGIFAYTRSVPVGMRSCRRNVEGIGPRDAGSVCVEPRVAPKSAGSGPGLCEGLYRGENALKSTPAGREHAKMAEYRKSAKKWLRLRFPLAKRDPGSRSWDLGSRIWDLGSGIWEKDFQGKKFCREMIFF